MSIHRRAVIAGLGALVAAAAPAHAQDTSVSGTITFAAYSGIFQDNYQKAVVEPFM
jgi:putative spermidine/putrescine transport system substrate-binding protein